MSEASLLGGEQDRADKLVALADGLAGTVRLLRVMVDARRAIDLTGLESRIGLLCAQALDLPPAQGKSMVASLAAVLAEVDALTTALARAEGPHPAPML